MLAVVLSISGVWVHTVLFIYKDNAPLRLIGLAAQEISRKNNHLQGSSKKNLTVWGLKSYNILNLIPNTSK
jgi:hypothetical protein